MFPRQINLTASTFSSGFALVAWTTRHSGSVESSLNWLYCTDRSQTIVYRRESHWDCPCDLNSPRSSLRVLHHAKSETCKAVHIYNNRASKSINSIVMSQVLLIHCHTLTMLILSCEGKYYIWETFLHNMELCCPVSVRITTYYLTSCYVCMSTFWPSLNNPGSNPDYTSR